MLCGHWAGPQHHCFHSSCSSLVNFEDLVNFDIEHLDLSLSSPSSLNLGQWLPFNWPTVTLVACILQVDLCPCILLPSLYSLIFMFFTVLLYTILLNFVHHYAYAKEECSAPKGNCSTPLVSASRWQSSIGQNATRIPFLETSSPSQQRSSARSKQPWHHSTTHGVADSA